MLLSCWFTQIQYKSALKNLFFINLTFRQFCGLKSLSWLFVTGWKTKVLHAVSSSETSFCKTPSDLLVFSSERRLLCSLRVNYSESRGGKSLKPPLSAAYLRGVNGVYSSWERRQEERHRANAGLAAGLCQPGSSGGPRQEWICQRR